MVIEPPVCVSYALFTGRAMGLKKIFIPSSGKSIKHTLKEIISQTDEYLIRTFLKTK